MDKSLDHICTSDCRREGCPLCEHGVHEDVTYHGFDTGCAICDEPQVKQGWTTKQKIGAVVIVVSALLGAMLLETLFLNI